MGKLIAPVVAAGTMSGVGPPDIQVDDDLALRAWRAEDVPVVVEAFSDPDIQRWHCRRYDSEDEALGWIASRACIAATRWAHALGLHRVQLEHSVENDASRGVALRAGYLEEGVRRGANLHADGWHDMRLYAHLETD